MSDQDTNQGGLPFSGGIAIFIALIAGYAFIDPAALNGLRPQTGAIHIDQIHGSEDVQARLWQDPFAAAQKHSQTETTTLNINVSQTPNNNAAQYKTTLLKHDSPEEYKHSLEALHDQIKQEHNELSKGITVLAVMVEAGPYAEQAETRLRMRYSIVSGLVTSGYQPEEAAHIGYVKKLNENQYIKGNHGERVALPAIMPYEWYKKDSGNQQNNNSQYVLLVWLDESAFKKSPLTKLNHLFGQLRDDEKHINDIKLIGPANSGTLKSMAKELAAAGVSNNFRPFPQLSDQTEIYSARTTVIDSEISSNKTASLTKQFLNADIIFERTIADDGLLTQKLIKELDQRIFDFRFLVPSDKIKKDNFHIAIISEWDTLYARALPKALGVNLCEHFNVQETCSEFQREHLHKFSYMRGLDGQLHSNFNADKNSLSQSKDRKQTLALIEGPEGRSQKDYLRRLATRISQVDQDLKNQGKKGIRAIGVLGSDVYDKLMILQALRERFPKAIFFTTDLDANLMHSKNLQWTRNMIVASAFDLQLGKEHQIDIPPFRDSYQTSVYLTTLIALEYQFTKEARTIQTGTAYSGSQSKAPLSESTFATKKIIASYTPEGRVYEISREGAFDLSAFDQPQLQSKFYPQNTAVISDKSHLKAAAIFLLIIMMGFHFSQKWKVSYDIRLKETDKIIAYTVPLFTLTLISFTYYLLPPFIDYTIIWIAIFISCLSFAYYGIKSLKKSGKYSPFDNYRYCIIILITILILLIDNSDEPFSLTLGISTWPTEILRFAAMFLAVFLLCKSWGKFQKNSTDIQDKLKLKQPDFTKELDKKLEASRTLKEGSKKHINDIWYRYCYFGKKEERFKRIIFPMIIWLAICTIIFFIQKPNTPFRGDINIWIEYFTIIFAFATFIALFVFVVDATMHCRHTMKKITAGKIIWPFMEKKESTGIITSTHKALINRIKCEWNNIEFIGMSTMDVSRTVYYPIYVMLLLLAAQSDFFDNLDMPASLMLIASVNIAITLVVAILLRKTALKAKETSLEELHHIEIEALAMEGDNRTKTFEKLRYYEKKIINYRKGAYLPLTEQPWVRALTLFGSGGGSLLLLDYMSRVS